MNGYMCPRKAGHDALQSPLVSGMFALFGEKGKGKMGNGGREWDGEWLMVIGEWLMVDGSWFMEWRGRGWGRMRDVRAAF